MIGGFFRRIARKWWLMLVVGIVIGLAAGLLADGKLMPGGLTGTSSHVYQLTVNRGNTFYITFSNFWGQKEIGWVLDSYDPNYVTVTGEYPGRGEYDFYARWEGTTSIFFKMGEDVKEYQVTINRAQPPPYTPNLW